MGVVDERSELGACYQGVPQNDLGMRTDVLDCCPKSQGMDDVGEVHGAPGHSGG